MAGHPEGITNGAWDPRDDLRCPAAPHPSFGVHPKVGGWWWHRGSDYYDFECLIRAGASARSGGGLWILRLPKVSGYRLYVDPPHFTNGEQQNSYMVAMATIGMSTGAHIHSHLHTRTTVPSSDKNERELIFTKEGTLFIGGGAWAPANLHVQTHRSFRGRWVAEP